MASQKHPEKVSIGDKSDNNVEKANLIISQESPKKNDKDPKLPEAVLVKVADSQ